MKRRIIAIVMASLLSVSLLAGCGKEASDSEDDDVRTERNVEDNENKENGTVTASIDTKNFDKMMDAYKDFYNEFCEENLKPYSEDFIREGCDCAAKIVINPDDNRLMLVIADIVDVTGGEAKVDLYFYQYDGENVKKYLEIPSLWATVDGIYVGNIADGLYVSTTSRANRGEHYQYRISDGNAEEITQSKDDTEEWVTIDTENGKAEMFLPYTLIDRIFTDSDYDSQKDNKFSVSERDFEDWIDYLKNHIPNTSTELTMSYGDYLIENRLRTNPYTVIEHDGIQYLYVREQEIIEWYWMMYDNYYINGTEPDMSGYLFPCVNNLLDYDYPATVDGYEVYPFEEKHILEVLKLVRDTEAEYRETKKDSDDDDLLREQYALELEEAISQYGYHLKKDNHFDVNWGGKDNDNGLGASEETAPASSTDASAGDTASTSSADDEILQKYQDYIDDKNLSVDDSSGGCVFYDIDGDGTPELLCNITAQFQTILYEDCNGDISEINGVQWYGAGDGRIIQRSEAGDIYFNYLSEGIVVDTVYIEVELEPTDNDPYAAKYYYSSGDTYEEISDEEYQSYFDEMDADDNLLETWQLYNDVCHGSDIQGAWDLYQKYN